MGDLRIARCRDAVGGCFFLALLMLGSACRFEHDTAEPGFYGNTQGGAGAGGARVSTAGGQGVQGMTVSMSTGATMATTPTTPTTPTSGSSAGSGSPAASTAGVVAAPSGGTTAAVSAGGAAATITAGSGVAGMSATSAGAGGGMSAGTPAMTPTSPCDLTGRWLSTLHYATDALGQIQFTHTYIYYEIAQQGDAFMITKGLHCGDDAKGSGSLTADVDFKKSWTSCMSRVSYQGRTGTSMQTANGCQVEFAKWYVVRGATLPYYLDPAIALPSIDDKATDTKPGWEDWDGDGNAGISGTIMGAVSGKIFVAPRTWTSLSGSVADLSTVFKLPMQWDQQQNVMGYDGSPLLATEAARASNAMLHFGQFVRLTPDQATGDDAAICKAIVDLAPMLTPEAAGL